ncbi:MAG: hypothetical protein AB8B91_11435 [Rubripirellula sp.]
MSVRKLTASLLTALMLLSGVATVSAQQMEHMPLQDPFAFDPDFRWFEPVYDADLMDMKPKKRAAHGWFATYDRLNLYGSRPETTEPDTAPTRLDSGWGHRYEIGYMLPGEDKGWLFNWTETGVGAFFTQRHEALNRYNGDQVIGGSGGGSATFPPFGFTTPPGEDNNLGFPFRFIDEQDTENVLSYDSYELNKTWRMEPYHYGGILEPMVGLRWMRIKDTNAAQDFTNTLGTIPGSTPLVSPFFGAAEQLTTSLAETDNEMLGGQIGFRYFKYRDRFTFSSDFRVFGGGNWQSSKSQRRTDLTIYNLTANTVTIGDPPVEIRTASTKPIYSRNEEFFVGFDVRAEVGYQLTKMVSIRGGFQLIDIGRGLWRGGDGSRLAGGDNDQDLQLVGGTFGINLNH